MNVLLLSMPDSFEHMPSVAIRMPNGALASLAGNVDPHHRVAIADLILARRDVRSTVERLVRDLQPDVLGLSVMTFQRGTALNIAAFVRRLRPGISVVWAVRSSLAQSGTSLCDVDLFVRGKASNLCEMLRSGNRRGFTRWRASIDSGRVRSNPDRDRPLHRIRYGSPTAPLAAHGYTLLGATGTSRNVRGCTFDCSLSRSSIDAGRNFHGTRARA